MRVLHIPNYQCTKCFLPYVGIMSPNKEEVEFAHYKFNQDEKCVDANRTFKQSIAQFLIEVI